MPDGPRKAGHLGTGTDLDDWLLRNWWTVGASAFALTALALVASLVTAVRATTAEQLVGQTFEVRQIARQLLSDLQDAEIGQRGFLLTKDASYLEPYNRAISSIPNTFSSIRALTRDSELDQRRLSNLKPLIDAKLSLLQTTVTLAKQGRYDDAVSVVVSNKGNQLMDSIRAELAVFAQTERDLLDARLANVATLRTVLLATMSLCLIAAIALASAMGRSLQQSLARLRERTRELETEGELRQQAEDTLRQAQKIEAVGQLTGGIAHDFNNLLTIILGNLDTIKRRLSAAATEEIEGFASTLMRPVDLALQGTRSAAQLTHRLLAFSRRQTLEPKRIDLNRSIADMSDLLSRTLGETIGVETVLAGGLWPTFVDKNQLENALVNLAINARDAMREGGRLTIETGNSYLDEAYARRFGDIAPGQYVVLSVTDTGSGISPEILPKVFEPFFTTKPVGVGSGLGLAMIHGFVKQSNGHIRIYSEVGHGTTVKIYLPRFIDNEQTAAPAPSPQSTTAPARARAQETILVVEDNDGVREYARAALEDLGYRVLEAADAARALQVNSAGARVDLLFTDVVLPGGMNGRELANHLVAQRPTLPVLFTTGYTRNAIVHHGRLDANVHLLSKPYAQQDLARKVREILDGQPSDDATPTN